MKVLFDDGKVVVIILDNKEAGALVNVVDSALNQKPMNKRSGAYKLATALDGELPV